MEHGTTEHTDIVATVEQFKEEYERILVGELANSTLEYLQKYADGIHQMKSSYDTIIRELRNDLPSHSEAVQEDVLFAFSKALSETIELIVYGCMNVEEPADSHRHGPKVYEPLETNGHQPIFAVVDYDHYEMSIWVDTSIEDLLEDACIQDLLDDVKQQIYGQTTM